MEAALTHAKSGKFDARLFHMIFEEEIGRIKVGFYNRMWGGGRFVSIMGMRSHSFLFKFSTATNRLHN